MLVANIKALCKAKCVSLAEVERATSLGNGVIRRWDEVSPRLESVKRVADFFGVTVDALLRKEE